MGETRQAVEALEARVASLSAFTDDELEAVNSDVLLVAGCLATVTRHLVARMDELTEALGALDRPTAYAPDEGAPDPDALAQAVAEERELLFLYTDGDDVQSSRHVRAQGLAESAAGDVLLHAFDLDREHARAFRVDRMEACGVVIRDEAGD
jgi:predicted DNA-binding transcriptional regulator YafY